MKRRQALSRILAPLVLTLISSVAFCQTAETPVPDNRGATSTSPKMHTINVVEYRHGYEQGALDARTSLIRHHHSTRSKDYQQGYTDGFNKGRKHQSSFGSGSDKFSK